MKKIAEAKASTVDMAVEQALQELGVSKDRVNVEILAKGGLFSKAHVRVSVIEDAVTKTEDLVNGILERMGLVSRAKVTDQKGTICVEIEGEDSGNAIGYRGEALDAFQYLVLTYLNQEHCDFKKVVVDSENYREKRRETLTALALRLAEKAQRTCRKVELEPMNPFERRVIHSALADSEIADTVSEGEEFNRHVVIIPKGVEIKEDRPRRDHKDRNRKDGRDRRNNTGRNRNDRERTRSRDDSREEEQEVPDGNVYRFFSEQNDFVKPTPAKTPPKFKSFGGPKRR